MSNTETQLRRWRIAWYGRSMHKKIVSALQGLILISTIAPFVLVVLLSTTLLYLGTPHTVGFYDVFSLFSIHGLMVVWLLIQGESASGGPMNHEIICSLPIDGGVLARVEYSVLLIVNNLIWIFFIIAAVMASYSDWPPQQTLNFCLIMVAVSTIGILFQLGVVRKSFKAIVAAVVLDAVMIAVFAWPVLYERTYVIVALIVASIWISFRTLMSEKGVTPRGPSTGTANRYYQYVLVDPIVAMNIRWLLTSGLPVLGLRVSVIAMALAAPILIARGSDNHEVVQVAMVVGMGICGLATAGLFRTFVEFHALASTFVKALPLGKWALPIKDIISVAIINYVFLVPFVFGAYYLQFIDLLDILLLITSHILLLIAYKFGTEKFETQSVLVSAAITIGWILVMSLSVVPVEN